MINALTYAAMEEEGDLLYLCGAVINRVGRLKRKREVGYQQFDNYIEMLQCRVLLETANNGLRWRGQTTRQKP